MANIRRPRRIKMQPYERKKEKREITRQLGAGRVDPKSEEEKLIAIRRRRQRIEHDMENARTARFSSGRLPFGKIKVAPPGKNAKLRIRAFPQHKGIADHVTITSKKPVPRVRGRVKFIARRR